MEDEMAKTNSGGPSNAHEEGYFDRAYSTYSKDGTVVEEDREDDDVSVGTSSSSSHETSLTLPSPEPTNAPLLVPTTDNPFSLVPVESSTASTTDGSGTDDSRPSDALLNPFAPDAGV